MIFPMDFNSQTELWTGYQNKIKAQSDRSDKKIQKFLRVLDRVQDGRSEAGQVFDYKFN